MARARKLAPWMVDALALGLSPDRIRSKVTALRASKAKKFGQPIPVMEVVFGWDLDEMASSLVHAIRDERCRGPRCARMRFADLVTADHLLALVTCDVIDPETPPVWCMNIRWCCNRDNSGDRDTSMRRRVERLVAERTAALSPVLSTPAVRGGQLEFDLWCPHENEPHEYDPHENEGV